MGDQECSGGGSAEILNGWPAKASLQKVIFKQRRAGGQGGCHADVGEAIRQKQRQVQGA